MNKYAGYFIWLGAVFVPMAVAAFGLPLVIEATFPLFDIGYNQATAGGYSMEVVVTLVALVVLLWRVVWALRLARTPHSLRLIVSHKASVIALSLSFFLFMSLKNRAFWWYKHMFTDQAYPYMEYTGVSNAILTSLIMCVLVYAVHDQPSNKKARKNTPLSLFALGAGILAFVAGAAFYAVQTY